MVGGARYTHHRWSRCSYLRQVLHSLLFVVFVTPFEVAFVEDTKVNLLFVMNQIVNCVFIYDIFLTFALPVEDKVGRMLKSHKLIAKKYLTSWFFLDVITVFPFDLMYLGGAFGPPEAANVDPATLRAIRLMRLLRL